jgi:hypothetical protein
MNNIAEIQKDYVSYIRSIGYDIPEDRVWVENIIDVLQFEGATDKFFIITDNGRIALDVSMAIIPPVIGGLVIYTDAADVSPLWTLPSNIGILPGENEIHRILNIRM